MEEFNNVPLRYTLYDAVSYSEPNIRQLTKNELVSVLTAKTPVLSVCVDLFHKKIVIGL